MGYYLKRCKVRICYQNFLSRKHHMGSVPIKYIPHHIFYRLFLYFDICGRK